MFKFGFQPEELNEEFVVSESADATENASPTAAAAIPCVACTELHPTADQLSRTPADIKHGLILFEGGNEVAHVKSDVLLEDLVEEQIHQRLREEREAQNSRDRAADQHATDLIPGVYEGGGKIWECTQDLGDYLGHAEEEDDDDIDEDGPSRLKLLCGAGKTVLDLGCGAGILGVLALQHGAEVHFQDYNSDIISKVTIPNAVLNSTLFRNLMPRARFFAGDWSHFVAAQLSAAVELYDVILTCETIYNPANNQKIIDVLRRLLRPKTGVAYLAAKTYYFGVGGGVRAFEALLRQDGGLRSEVVWQSTENVQREILKITHV